MAWLERSLNLVSVGGGMMISPTKSRKEQFFWAASRPRHFYTGGYALVKA